MSDAIRELDQPTNNGITVTLFWNAETNGVFVSVVEERYGMSVEFAVSAADAADASTIRTPTPRPTGNTMRSPHEQSSGQDASSKPSEVVGEAFEQGDDSGDLGSLGGIEAVTERPPHMLIYCVLPAGEHAAAAFGDRGYHPSAVGGVLRADDKASLLERGKRGSDRLRRDALDIGQGSGCQRAETVQTYQNRDLKESGIGGGVGRRVELAKSPTDSTDGHTQVNRRSREASGCLGHGGKASIPNAGCEIQSAKVDLPKWPLVSSGLRLGGQCTWS